MWRALSGLSVTHGAWLGRGRDASQGTYDSLRLACAWRIQNPRRSARVEGGTRCMSDELDCLKRKGGVAREVWRDMMTSSTAAALEAQGKLQLRAELNEVLLLHGIPRSKLLTVLANGLNERFSGTHAGAAFGNGAYLAEDLGKADPSTCALTYEVYRPAAGGPRAWAPRRPRKKIGWGFCPHTPFTPELCPTT